MGRCEVERDKPIVGIADIVGLETDLKREFKAEIVVLGFQRFEALGQDKPIELRGGVPV